MYHAYDLMIRHGLRAFMHFYESKFFERKNNENWKNYFNVKNIIFNKI